MSVKFEQADGVGGGGATVPPLAPPQLCNPKEASSAAAVAAPSFKSSRRVKLRICGLDAFQGTKVAVPAKRFVLEN